MWAKRVRLRLCIASWRRFNVSSAENGLGLVTIPSTKGGVPGCVCSFTFLSCNTQGQTLSLTSHHCTQSLLYLFSSLDMGKCVLVLAFVLPPREFDGNVGHVIPRVVDADEQEQHRCRGDDEQCRCRIAWKQNRRDDERGVRDQRQNRMKQPVFHHRL